MADSDFKPGDAIPGAEAHEPPAPTNGAGDAPPDLNVTPEAPPESPREAPSPPTPRKLRHAELRSQLEDLFGGVAIMVMTTGDEYCANVIATQAEPLAEAWSELAKKNARVKAMLEMLLQGSAWGQVVMVTAATVIPIAAHHGFYPKGFPMPFSFGVGPPPPASDDVREAGEKDKEH